MTLTTCTRVFTEHTKTSDFCVFVMVLILQIYWNTWPMSCLQIFHCAQLENLWKKKRKVKGTAGVGVTCGGVPTLKGITEECWELMTTAWVSGGGRYFRLGGLNDLFSLCLHLSSPTLILPTCFILPTNVYHFTYIWVLLRMAFKGQDWLGRELKGQD